MARDVLISATAFFLVACHLVRESFSDKMRNTGAVIVEFVARDENERDARNTRNESARGSARRRKKGHKNFLKLPFPCETGVRRFFFRTSDSSSFSSLFRVEISAC